MSKSTIEKAFAQVQELINHFEAGIEHYLSASYQEAEVRKEYIDKFYSFLGWDVNHDFQKNPFEQEVKIEKAQRQQGGLGQKRADYAFFLAPNYKQEQFFVEAKKPSRTLRQNKDDYFQTAKYGWNAGTGVSILTDFEEIVIIDCRFRPDFDTILQNQIKYYNYKDFRDFDTFEEFYWIFSREALVAGNLSKYIEQLKKPKGTSTQLKLFGGKYQSIDESFLNYIDAKRYDLATAFYQNNTSLDAYSLTEATQRTIDRIVFIRFLEDKLIETDNIIHNIATATHPWAKFVEYSKYLDSKYNGIVFKPLFIDDKKFGGANDDLFKALCSDLDHTNTPYDFNYIPIHILGSIYERFLGKVVVIENGRATIEVKPEVRKAGGVFYTPKYIVDYIVKNTVGKLIEGKTPKQIADLTFADIACGSGSFLIGVFEYLLDYHNKWYNENPTIAKKDGCKYNEDFGVYVLSIQQKQHILLNNIYGVDIDLQATEVTQLSLFLKMLEDETTSTANDMMVLFHEKILPNLTNNIKCGNSLIGTDILTNKLDLDLDQERKLNPFDFKLGFAKVFKKGGFDAIVGNPPWVSLNGKFGNDIVPKFGLEYLLDKYDGNTTMPNLYEYFVHRGLDIIKPNGYFSIIIPDRLGFNKQFLSLRKKIITKYKIIELLYKAEFPGIVTDTLVFNFTKPSKDTNENYSFNVGEFGKYVHSKKINEYKKNKDYKFEYDLSSNSNLVISKIFSDTKNIPLGSIASTTSGFGGKSTEIFETRQNPNQIKVYRGRSISRYCLIKDYYFNFINENITGRTRDENKLSQKIKVLLRKTGNPLIATYDESGNYPEQSLYFIYANKSKISFKCLTGIFNSNLFQFIYINKLVTNKDSTPQLKKEDLDMLPIPKLNKSNQETHDTIVNLVEQMLVAKKQQQTAVTERDKSYLEDKCKNIDSQINDLVYKLYGLSDEEIGIVEVS